MPLLGRPIGSCQLGYVRSVPPRPFQVDRPRQPGPWPKRYVDCYYCIIVRLALTTDKDFIPLHERLIKVHWIGIESYEGP
jgi:hypothetical protein